MLSNSRWVWTPDGNLSHLRRDPAGAVKSIPGKDLARYLSPSFVDFAVQDTARKEYPPRADAAAVVMRLRQTTAADCGGRKLPQLIPPLGDHYCGTAAEG